MNTQKHSPPSKTLKIGFNFGPHPKRTSQDLLLISHRLKSFPINYFIFSKIPFIKDLFESGLSLLLSEYFHFAVNTLKHMASFFSSLQKPCSGVSGSLDEIRNIGASKYVKWRRLTDTYRLWPQDSQIHLVYDH